ncbi:hypothetical protein [Dinoroseobacter shibae]|uniref:hypothetical protein n=1 Tax=Dinoroseobacter shibae TaxID=215813 RepID=UPI00068193F5|nr:hypothetical protein [Dinoroseobacter shibae]URF45944.1 hypothetical protein M8008_14355 [Dinoroseobacter shibae]URF50250.1 hypothetical protein M8007_14355 [Dinoroseobacter shibae]
MLVLVAGCSSVPPNDVMTAEQRARDAALVSGQPMAFAEDGTPVVAEGAAAVAPDPDLLRRGAGISDENDFDAVSDRVSIEADQQRLAAQREMFQVIQPTALPERPSGDLAAIVEFALATSHPVGRAVYPRSTLRVGSGSNCNRYSNPNEAQQVFLEGGGPERDRRGLDPDGDGYACGWDPTPFRMAVRN